MHTPQGRVQKLTARFFQHTSQSTAVYDRGPNRRVSRFFAAGALAILIVVMASMVSMTGCGLNPQTLPTDPQATCTVPSTTFATWFQTGSPSLNGVVNPANSVMFPNSPNCSFYQWSEQMFMWLTSPAPPTYGGGGGRIMDSPTFYDVSPETGGVRKFLPHTVGLVRSMNLRVAQVGFHGLPLVFDRGGEMLEVRSVPAGTVLQVRDASGQLVTVAHARLAENRRLVLSTADGKAINVQPARKVTVTTDKRENSPVVQKFNIDGISIFIDPSLSVIDVEQGQADGGVLVTQGGSLVYFATMVNDVYAYFATGAKDGGITPTPTQFPTSAADLAKIVSFASAHSKTFPDPNALAIEVKSAWVEASSIPNSSSYITMSATIPTYNTSNPATWVQTGQKTTTLALVGIHVVGSAAGHPEMIWATFEHFANAPRADYKYINTSGQTVDVPQNTSANWLFAGNGSSGVFNCMHAQASGANIVAVNPTFPPGCTANSTISPSNVLRSKAFGAASDVSPNPIDGSTPASNTEIIAINNSVRGMILSGDLRQNYIITGATWTIGGAAPGGGNQVGTSQLSNTTMETFQQGPNNTVANGSSNCFSCHGTNTTAVSHVYGPLQPLF
jgi:hypothetical protein